MFIVSWNVAGLSTTINRIHESNSSNNNTKPSKKEGSSTNSSSASAATCSALATFLERHGGVDILCVQEHKIPRNQLVNRLEPRRVSTVPGYESFWSCCVDENSKGMNGVCTFARTGSVCAANAAPLGIPELDHQGRCVMTDHGEFVLFNVYVPASGGGQPLSYKLKFLNALRRTMNKERVKNGKPVILVGDLNITHAPLDIYWADRVVYITDVLQEATAAANNHHPADQHKQQQLPKWKLDVAQHWSSIAAALETIQAVEKTTRNTKTNEEFQKFRAVVTVCDNNNNSSKQVYLGRHESSEAYCTFNYDLLSQLTYQDPETGEECVAREANVVSVSTLTELMSKIAGVTWSEATQRDIADNYATADRTSPTRKWLTAVMEEDGMVDAFRHFYPNAQGRFTCWNQFTNRRYVNEGIRIDYTLVDRCLLDRIQQGVDCLRCCCSSSSCDQPTPTDRTDQQQQQQQPHSNYYHLTEQAALCAATANGRFQPVSFEGGGIQEATQEALNTQYGDGKPHTGMIYTPPSFSDHIAVSLLLDNSLLRNDLVLDTKNSSTNTNAAATKKAQPHKLQTSISSFFGAAAAGASKNANKNNSTNCKNSITSASTSTTTTTAKSRMASSVRPSQSNVAKKPKVAASSSSSPSSNKAASAFSSKKIKTAPPPAAKKNSILNHFRRNDKV